MPEVEKAASLVRTVALGKTIVKVETAEDAIVFSGVTHTDFVSPLITDFPYVSYIMSGSRAQWPHSEECGTIWSVKLYFSVRRLD